MQLCKWYLIIRATVFNPQEPKRLQRFALSPSFHSNKLPLDKNSSYGGNQAFADEPAPPPEVGILRRQLGRIKQDIGEIMSLADRRNPTEEAFARLEAIVL